jgi:non-specific serine/threonine protein kinase/serine/threonine-protein kinase
MDPQRWAVLREILYRALELPADERAEFLNEACGSDQAQRAELESLLQSADQPDQFLDHPLAHLSGPGQYPASPGSRIGHRIGPYEIVDSIGRGGMGEVYRARRADGLYDKDVAIKLVRSDWADSAVLERFSDERRILATLEHDHIARLYDGGTTDDGIPYLVIELVDGAPIDSYCESRHLTIDERLVLFVRVCDAVQYAHQHLVIHRDIKPGNILVTQQGEPKLLDFGIAKVMTAISGRDETRAALMTPHYASPEQLRGEPISTGSDVYSLGVVLYLLIAHHLPFESARITPHELARLICDVDPKPPCTALRAADRAARPRNVRDLDNIVLKALRKDPARRYPTVAQLADDLRRYLTGRAVMATPDSLGYRVRLFVRRHTLGVALFAAALVLTIAATVTIVTEARIAAENSRRAERRFDDVHALATSLVFELHDAIRDVPGSLAARRLLVERAIRYLDSLAQEAQGNVQLERELGSAFERLGTVQGKAFTNNLGDTEASQQSYAKAAALLLAVANSTAATRSDQIALLATLRRYADSLAITNHLSEAKTQAQRAIAIGEALQRTDPRDPALLVEIGSAYGTLAGILGENFGSGNLGKPDEALALDQKEVAVFQTLLSIDPRNPDYQARALVASVDLGDAMLFGGQVREAETYFEQTVGPFRSLAATRGQAIDREHLAAIDDRLAMFEMWAGDCGRALQYSEEALTVARQGSDADTKDNYAKLSLANELANTTGALACLHRTAEARRRIDEALTIIRSVAAADQNNALVRGNEAAIIETAGSVDEQAGELQSALSRYERAGEIMAVQHAADPSNAGSKLQLAMELLYSADMHAALRDVAGAAKLYQQVIADLNDGASGPPGESARYAIAGAYAGLGVLATASATRSADEDSCHWFALAKQTWSGIREPGHQSPDGYRSKVLERLKLVPAHCPR